MYQVAYPTGARPRSGFVNHGTAMHFWFSTGHATPLLDLYSPDTLKNVRFMKIPGPTGPSDQLGIMAGWGWAINPDSPRPDDAWQIIAFFLSEEIQKRFLASFAPGVLFGARRSLSYPEETPFLEDAMRIAEPPITTWGPVHPLFGEVVNVAQGPIYEAARGERPLGNALEEVQRLLTALFNQRTW